MKGEAFPRIKGGCLLFIAAIAKVVCILPPLQCEGNEEEVGRGVSEKIRTKGAGWLISFMACQP